MRISIEFFNIFPDQKQILQYIYHIIKKRRERKIMRKKNENIFKNKNCHENEYIENYDK